MLNPIVLRRDLGEARSVVGLQALSLPLLLLIIPLAEQPTEEHTANIPEQCNNKPTCDASARDHPKDDAYTRR